MQFALINRCTRQALRFGGLAALNLCLFSGVSVAQEEDAIEEIRVTGSRIARDPNLSGSLPVQSITEQEIQLSGEFSISDVVNDVPALLSSTTAESSIDSSFSDGAQILNLRGLGAARTLVLQDGRRHVGGVRGTSAVDVGSIPIRLVERVEVLTGGASAIYGADAVTGVVNFIMKDDYEGFSIDANYGISSKGDGAQTAITATWGTNFANDRGNFAVSVDYRTDDGLSMGDRPGAPNGLASDNRNPDLRFQRGDISGSTPLFEQYYNYDNTGQYHYGLGIPSAGDFVNSYNAAFPGSPINAGNLNSAEMALINRRANAPARAIHDDYTFNITSGWGTVGAGNGFNFGGWDPDVAVDQNNNGTPDCQDSWLGYNSSFSAAGFGVVGGCWRINENGSYSIPGGADELVAGNFNGWGASDNDVYRQTDYTLLLPDEKVSVNVLGSFDITDTTRVFGEFKFVSQETEQPANPNSFWDLLMGSPDNPFLPAWLQTVAAGTGGVSNTIDPIGFGSTSKTERETARAVIGLEGEFDNSWSYEISATYGRFEQSGSGTRRIINDRWFAAIDAVSDPVSGAPTCRSSVDPLAPPGTTPFGIPAYDPGYFSFTPGDGSCIPLDIWNGAGGYSQAAMDWVMTDTWSNLVIDQAVVSAFVNGDTSDFFELPHGPISFAVGAEYREESSDATFDPWQRGVIPPGSPTPAGGQLIDISGNDSLTFRPQLSTKDEQGSYDVSDVFIEASIPLLRDVPFARELTLDFAARLSNYSTVGKATTWKTNLIWAPADSFAVRATYSESVRAPNISELFAPTVGLNFRPDDPCAVSEIQALDPVQGAQVQANCEQVFTSIGLDPTYGTGTYAFVDPLSASFGGTTSGNPLLMEETAETLTVGFVYQPEFIAGLSLTVDYWDISIADAIQAVSSQNIVDGCYQGPTLNVGFCDLTGRNSDPLSPQFGGFNYLSQTTLNFAKLETNGIDFSAKYQWEIGAHGFDVTVRGTTVDQINNFENPSNPTFMNPELGEINRPDLAGNVLLNWTNGDMRFGWQSQYMGEMLYGGIEVETAELLYGRSVFQEATWQHDINASYNLNDKAMIYGGIKNVTEESPFRTENAFPFSPRGRFFFIGVDYLVN
ncbi:MAG: TonB-dependent receptor [Woeseia sp.]|jgi:iron complex outermembrane recepter protein|nr:TonB-dependent receptor [Woeseia sp.]